MKQVNFGVNKLSKTERGLIMDELVFLKKDKAVCSSLEIAEHFKKRHDHVIRDIEEKILNVVSKDFAIPNFGETSYVDQWNRIQKMYLMTRDGFSLLAMSFTGKRAMEWKIKYIQAFNKMEQLLLEKRTQEWQETRREGKLTRKSETDIIKQLVEYAEKQGSQHPDKLYVVYSNLANKMVGIRSRELATITQINNLAAIENIILHVIQEGIKRKKGYKEIYQDCKGRLDRFQEVTYLRLKVCP